MQTWDAIATPDGSTVVGLDSTRYYYVVLEYKPEVKESNLFV